MLDKEMEDLLTRLNIFAKAFDTIRIVDPINKQQIEVHDNKLNNIGLNCYQFWSKNKICDNCISIRAYMDNITYVKMEYNNSDICMVTAIPIEILDRRVVIELLRNATNSIVMEGNQNEKFSEIHAVIDNMNHMLIKDTLTGIYNRRYINEKLPINLVNAAISDSELSIIMTDVDNFKAYNDTYGHLGGDHTLKCFADILHGSLTKENDWVARYGGDEFLICLPETSHSHAVKIAEAIRENVESAKLEYGEKTIKITASLGVVTITPELGSTVNELIESADRKLYEAKRNGRNRVEA